MKKYYFQFIAVFVFALPLFFSACGKMILNEEEDPLWDVTSSSSIITACNDHFFRFFLKKSVSRAAHSFSRMPLVTVVEGCSGDDGHSEKPRLASVAP